MFSATDLIEALHRRARKSLRPEHPPGEFPEGWARWLETMAQRIGSVTGAHPDAIVAILVSRELALPPRRTGDLNRWQSFATLWRQQWQPPEPEERRVRWLAIAITAIVHVFLLVILLWLAYVRFTAVQPAQGEEIVQVEYVGTGTPKTPGGGSPSPATKQAATRPQPVVRPAEPAPPAPSPLPSQAPAESAPAPPVTPVPTPPVEQPLQVTEKSQPGATFVLPPPTPRHVETPQVRLQAPQIQVPQRSVELVEAPPAPVAQPAPPVTTAPAKQPTPTPAEAAAPLPNVPLPKVALKPVPPQPLATPRLQATAPAVQSREIPMPPSPSENAAATATAQPRAAQPAPSQATSVAGGPPANAGARPTATTPGSGPATAPKPGAWPTPTAGDDWGISNRNRPGGNAGKPGLLNPNGTPRLPAGTAQPGGGLPPGTDHWTTEQFDRAGTWLKRPPNDYTPTRFEKVWVPNETLLEEWVRRNIREMSIPIPGTSKKLNCVISLLQLGGGCSISDPNLNDQEATARPPPDVPFKPELQEDQQSLRKPGKP